MGGGLMQLVAYGAQDIYLTGNPQITFFKVVYRRHTNFSMESIEQTWNGITNVDGKCTSTISRNGDLIHRVFIHVRGDLNNENTNHGSNFINTVELEIGGQMIDRHTGYWMETWAEVCNQQNQGRSAEGVALPIAANGDMGGPLFQRMSGMGGMSRNNAGNAANGVNHCFDIPLQFWFCRNVGLALPLIALQYHEVKVILDHKVNTYFGRGVTVPTLQLWVDYIYLDTDERRRFAQVSHEYLIEQVQENSLTQGAQNTELTFNHPVKELLWIKKPTFRTVASVAGALALGYDANGVLEEGAATELLSGLTNLLAPTQVEIGAGGILSHSVDQTTLGYGLKLNGHERFAPRPAIYFTRTQLKQHHSGTGGVSTHNVNIPGLFHHNDSIGIYSFALKPEEHQPSGTCNFSRIDTAEFISQSVRSIADTIFAVNYNVLRIMSGMGGLAYSN